MPQDHPACSAESTAAQTSSPSRYQSNSESDHPAGGFHRSTDNGRHRHTRLWVKPKKMSPSSPKTVTNRSPSSNRYAGRPATMETLIRNVASSILALSIPALRAAWEGERLTEVSSSSGSVRSRSLSVSSGMLAHIITMPEANQTAIKGASRMPNQRCNRIRGRRSLLGLGMIDMHKKDIERLGIGDWRFQIGLFSRLPERQGSFARGRAARMVD